MHITHNQDDLLTVILKTGVSDYLDTSSKH